MRLLIVNRSVVLLTQPCIHMTDLLRSVETLLSGSYIMAAFVSASI